MVLWTSIQESILAKHGSSICMEQNNSYHIFCKRYTIICEENANVLSANRKFVYLYTHTHVCLLYTSFTEWSKNCNPVYWNIKTFDSCIWWGCGTGSGTPFWLLTILSNLSFSSRILLFTVRILLFTVTHINLSLIHI